MPASFWTDPLVYQGGSDDFLGPTDDVPFPGEDFGIDLEAEVAVVTDDVAMGTGAAAARDHIRLIMLVNDWSLRNLIPAELAKGFGTLKPATTFAPRGHADNWATRGTAAGESPRVMSTASCSGHPEAGIDTTFDFPALIARHEDARLGAVLSSVRTTQLRSKPRLIVHR
jgi:fumarylacetoacetate (FAA) hydrolase